MILSMTGYGRSQYQDDQVFIRVDIKSVNSKQFDLKLKLPLDFAPKDPQLRSELQDKLIRGKIECYITLERQDQPPYLINETAVEMYFQTLKNLAKQLGYKINHINALEIIMQLPDVLKPNIIDEDQETWEKLHKTLNQAVEQLIEFRKQEGQAISKDITQKLDLIEKYLKQIPKYENQRIQTVKNRLLNALNQLKVDYDKERFEQELLYYLDKYDINEEKSRLQNHINYFRQVMQSSNINIGKNLTFIAQEMGREINTLGVKANDFNIQQLVVKMKDNLEKIKEQLANAL